MVPSKATHSLTEETTCAGVSKKFGSKEILAFQGTHWINVCWNKHFKARCTKSYHDWFEAGKQEYKAAGNHKSAPLEVIVGWIVKAWDFISTIIVNSFKVFGLTNNFDRSEDEQIIIFKDKKCCASCCLAEFWDQPDSKTPAINIEEAGHAEMNQYVIDFIDFDENLSIDAEKSLDIGKCLPTS